MWTVHSLQAAIPAVILGLFTLGLMPVCWKHLELKGRCLGHTLLDFGFVSLFGGCGAALLFGSEPPGEGLLPPITHQISQQNGKLAAFAIASGVCFTLSDVCLQQAMPLVGIVTTAAISNALRIIISVLTNYWLDSQLNHPTRLFPGLVLALLAIIFSTAAQIDHRKTHKRKMRLSEVEVDADDGKLDDLELVEGGPGATASARLEKDQQESDKDILVTVAPTAGDLAKNSVHRKAVAEQTPEMGCMPLDLGSRKVLVQGLMYSAACGSFYGLYSPAFNIASNDPWHLAPEGVQPLSEWLALFYLYVGLFAVSVTINTYLIYRPIAGSPSTLSRYLKDWGPDRMIAILSGIFGLIAAITELIGGQAGGYAFASLVAAYPLVTTIVGIFVFKEFQGATCRTKFLIAGQFSFYCAAIAMLASSAAIRSED